jgi:hypothetical protein
MTSIKDSVHKLLCDQIESTLACWGSMRSPKTASAARTEQSSAFVGLSNNVANIKSYEGVDIAGWKKPKR